MMTTDPARLAGGASDAHSLLDLVRDALCAYGLHVLGVAQAQPGEVEAAGADRDVAQTLILVGNAGSSMWAAFSASSEYQDGLPDALDRWSRRVGEHLAHTLGLHAFYPFGGPPHYPFQRWATRAAEVHPSPLRLQIHPEFGLWHAYRFALASAVLLPQVPIPTGAASPCLSCADPPCLRACPAHAFDDGYDAGACLAHLQTDPSGSCAMLGCAARHACPVGVAYRYQPEHAQFHMRAFAAAAGANA